MRKADAPAPGWFPDPQNETRLRWWDGEDWTDIRRAPPSDAEVQRYEELQRLMSPTTPPSTRSGQQPFDPNAVLTRQDSQQIISEVRNAARAEVDRAADLFSQRASYAVRQVTPLITGYTNRLIRIVKVVAVLAIVLLVAYFVFQVVAQASFFEWIGDRIDNWTNDDQSGLAPSGTSNTWFSATTAGS